MKMVKTLLCWIALSFQAAPAAAAPVQILFFNPGGQGSQEAAQPLLDNFAASLKQAAGGKIDAAVTYLSDPAAGITFIKTQKPAAAVLSLDAYYQYATGWGATMIARTLQLPSGDGSDQYFIVGKKGATLPASGAVTLTSPRPLAADFVAKKLFPKLSGLSFTILPNRNVMGALRAVGSGEKSDFILLDQFEYANVMRLRAAWVAGLGTAAESKKVSSAPVVVFPANAPGGFGPELQKALIQMGKDSTALLTLQEMRLKGFMAAQTPD